MSEIKIYYEVPDEAFYLEETASKVSNDLPPELSPFLEPLLTSTAKLAHAYAVSSFEKMKYEVMWALRALEKEIEEENGVIILTSKGQIATKDFSRELTDKIGDQLKLHYK